MDLLTDINSLDVALFRAINSGLTHGSFDILMVILSSRLVWWTFGVVATMVALWRYRLGLLPIVIVLGIAIGLSDMISASLLKPWIGRERPCKTLPDVQLVDNQCGGVFGFPSNHAANAAAASVTVSIFFRRRSMIIVSNVLALLVGFSRIYLGVHYPGDVFGGFVLGALLGVLSYFAFTRLQKLWKLPVAKPT